MDGHTGDEHMRRLDPPEGDDRLLWDLHASEHFLLWLAAADELGLFRALEATSVSPEEIARQLKLGLTAAESLLGVLAALGFVVQYDGQYALTRTSRDFLLPSSPYYRGAWLEAIRRRPRLTYENVTDALREDRPIDDRYWAVEDSDPTQARTLAQGLHTLSMPSAPALAEAADFSRVRRLLDVGGGSGGMSIALARAYPALHGTVLDQPVPCAYAAEVIAAYGVGGQVETRVADLFSGAWPDGCDAVLLSNVLNSFDAPRCQRLIQKAHDYLPSGGALFIQEMLLRDTKDGPLGVIGLSLYDHLGSRGQQWTASEVKAMLLRAGFALKRVTPAYGYNVVLSATKR